MRPWSRAGFEYFRDQLGPGRGEDQGLGPDIQGLAGVVQQHVAQGFAHGRAARFPDRQNPVAGVFQASGQHSGLRGLATPFRTLEREEQAPAGHYVRCRKILTRRWGSRPRLLLARLAARANWCCWSRTIDGWGDSSMLSRPAPTLRMAACVSRMAAS